MFSVDNRSDVKHRLSPLECFFPLARGRVFDPDCLGLYTFKKESKSAQFSVLSRWADSSIRWISIDTEITLGKMGKSLFIIACGKSKNMISASRL